MDPNLWIQPYILGRSPGLEDSYWVPIGTQPVGRAGVEGALWFTLTRPAVAVAQRLSGSRSKDYLDPAPHILVVHLGGNDLGLVKGKAFVLQVKGDLEHIWMVWLGVQVLWSAMIPCKSWRWALYPGAMEKAHKNANWEIRPS